MATTDTDNTDLVDAGLLCRDTFGRNLKHGRHHPGETPFINACKLGTMQTGTPCVFTRGGEGKRFMAVVRDHLKGVRGGQQA